MKKILFCLLPLLLLISCKSPVSEPVEDEQIEQIEEQEETTDEVDLGEIRINPKPPYTTTPPVEAPNGHKL